MWSTFVALAMSKLARIVKHKDDGSWNGNVRRGDICEANKVLVTTGLFLCGTRLSTER